MGEVWWNVTSQASSNNGKLIREGAIKTRVIGDPAEVCDAGVQGEERTREKPYGGSGSRAAAHHKDRHEVWLHSFQPADCFISNYPNYLAW